MKVRLATPDDAVGVNAVYNPFIADSPATFETTEISEADRRAWLERLLEDRRHPVLSPSMARRAYAGSPTLPRSIPVLPMARR